MDTVDSMPLLSLLFSYLRTWRELPPSSRAQLPWPKVGSRWHGGWYLSILKSTGTMAMHVNTKDAGYMMMQSISSTIKPTVEKTICIVSHVHIAIGDREMRQCPGSPRKRLAIHLDRS